jgi:hypothetical protein
MVDCTKQAQGNFDGMCKFHFKESRVDLKAPPDFLPEGQSVYETILPESMAFVSNGTNVMPLVAHLKHGFDTNRPRGWHRNDERLARGLWPVQNSAVQLQGWERELVWMEICILSGNPQASFRHLARAWGRDKGFHMVLAQFICDRRGNVERKTRVKGKENLQNGKKNRQKEEFLDDILDFEDMELPIEMLDALRDSDTEEESESAHDSPSNAEGCIDPLDEHLLMAPNDHEQVAMENVESTSHVTEAVISSSQAQALRDSDTEEESESARDSPSNAEGCIDPLDEHLLTESYGHEPVAMENV